MVPLDPRPATVITIPQSASRQNTSVPQLQYYNPSGDKLDITSENDGDGGNETEDDNFIPRRIRGMSPRVVKYRGQFHVWSMDDWWPMPAEMWLAPDDGLLKFNDVGKLPKKGPSGEVGRLSPDVTVDE